jgi:hypothetical protein
LGPKRDEVTGEWRRLHNEEFHNLYLSPNIIWMFESIRMIWTGHVAHMGERRGAHSVLVEYLEGKKLLRRPGCGSEDNVSLTG